MGPNNILLLARGALSAAGKAYRLNSADYPIPITDILENSYTYTCCRVPEGQGLHKATRPPGRDDTRSLNPLVRTQVNDGQIQRCSNPNPA